jgi:ArsR family transcriptional regulator, arsenate/arsenite/antimonite-responsive transcriptional repressor
MLRLPAEVNVLTPCKSKRMAYFVLRRITKDTGMPAVGLQSKPRLKHTECETIAQLAKALAHPARVMIIRALLRRTTCIGCDIVEEIGLAASTTSEHLRILKEAGVIIGEIERPRVCYSLNPDALKPLTQFLGQAAAHTSEKRRV